MKLHVPSGKSRVVLSDGVTEVPVASDFTVDVPTSEAPALLATGFAYVGNPDGGVLPQASRPTIGLFPGQVYFDKHLGHPVWRTAGGTWVNAAGQAEAFTGQARFDWAGSAVLTVCGL